MKKCLIISYFFPPSCSTGGTRPLKFVKYLRDFGWEPVVLTVKKSFDYDVPEDHNLLKEIPQDVSIYRTLSFEPLNWYWEWKNKATKNRNDKCKRTNTTGTYSGERSWKNTLINLFQIPDSYCGWIPFGLFMGLRVVVKEMPSVIFATTPCPSTLVIAYLLSIISKVPLIIDYRDPWISPNARFSKTPLTLAINRFLERQIVKKSAKVICVTQSRLNELLSNYNIKKEKGAVITNGYDYDDLKEICISERKSNKSLKLIHPGTLYRNDGLNEFMLALKLVIDEGCIPDGDINVCFLGSRPKIKIFDDLEKRGICKFLPRMPKKLALNLTYASDWVLIILDNSIFSRGVIASKIFDSMLLRKPVFGIIPEGETKKIIEDWKLGVAVGHNVGQIKNALVNIYNERNSELSLYEINGQVEKYGRQALTKNLSDIFQDVIK
jgi:glycosyltransferase involved in cell wall biosynthesis